VNTSSKIRRYDDTFAHNAIKNIALWNNISYNKLQRVEVKSKASERVNGL